MDWLGAVVRFVVSALVLMLVGLIVPGFGTLGFWQALLAAIVIAAMGWVVESVFGKKHLSLRPRNSWLLVSAAVIWAAQFFVPEMSVSLIGALIAAFAVGVIDMFVPTAIR
jgi:putative membrane protein